MIDQKIQKLTTATLVDFKVCEMNPKTLSETVIPYVQIYNEKPGYPFGWSDDHTQYIGILANMFRFMMQGRAFFEFN